MTTQLSGGHERAGGWGVRTEAELQQAVQLERPSASRHLCIPRHERARGQHEQEARRTEYAVHEAARGTACAFNLAFVLVLALVLVFGFGCVVVYRRWGRRERGRFCGGIRDARQVERSAADLMMYREGSVFIRRCRRRTTERPDDILHPVRRGLREHGGGGGSINKPQFCADIDGYY